MNLNTYLNNTTIDIATAHMHSTKKRKPTIHFWFLFICMVCVRARASCTQYSAARRRLLSFLLASSRNRTAHLWPIERILQIGIVYFYCSSSLFVADYECETKEKGKREKIVGFKVVIYIDGDNVYRDVVRCSISFSLRPSLSFSLYSPFILCDPSLASRSICAVNYTRFTNNF